MDSEEAPISVADARDGLSRTLKRFRAEKSSLPVVLGSHRKAEAVLLPYNEYRKLISAPAGSAPSLDELRRRSHLIGRLAKLNCIESVAVFGSVARGVATPESDVDLLVVPGKGASLFKLAQFEIDMEQLLGHNVDVVSRGALDPEIDGAILTDAIVL